MRKLIVLLSLVLLLVACGTENEPKKDNTSKLKDESETEQQGETEDIEDNVEPEVEIEEENNNEPVEEPEVSTATVEGMSDDELKEIIEYTGMGEDDELVSVSQVDGEIKAVIKVSPDDLFSPEIIAATRYSQLSDELLAYEGWEDLTIQYVDVGEISMNRSEKESNEYGDYFPTEKIDELLGVEY